MNWFPKKKNKATNPVETSPIELIKSCASLKELCHNQAETILKLEKEAVYWKDKALNFRKFHQ